MKEPYETATFAVPLATVGKWRNEDVAVNSFPTYDAVTPASRDLNKLSILRQQDLARTWRSLDDQRVCVLCGNEFRGSDIHIQNDHGQVSCHCPTPGCEGQIQHFVFPGNPLLDPHAWSDWMLALGGSDQLDGNLGALENSRLGD